jgi:SAM-dependent methyltransferase
MSLAVIAKGLATFVLPPALYNRSSGRGLSARYCYSVLLRHLIYLHGAGANVAPRIVAEIGPGASIGTGLAALIAGAERYYGFDIKAYAATADRLSLFDELVALFRARAAVPGPDEFPTIKPELPSHEFPAAILTEARLAAALAPERLARLRAALLGDGTEAPVRYAAPWFARTAMAPHTVDWIFSQAVMEHVDDLDGTYRACREWLAPGGAMSHQIDFKSHGTAAAWNGHWAYSDATWRMIRGGRLYLINRQPYSAHRAALQKAGFALAAEKLVRRDDGLPREKLAPRYRALGEDDRQTAGAFFVARPAA